MQNYNKAHKLNFKATKKQQKMLRQLDGDSDNKSNSQPKNKDSQNNNKSQSKKGNKNSAKKGKCSKCGKWGSHTAEECTTDESTKKTEEVNMATAANNRAKTMHSLLTTQEGLKRRNSERVWIMT